MSKERLGAYTDAVIAIIITIMVLEMEPPTSSSRQALYEMRHIVLGYILSFIYLTIYWNNHHHMFQTIKKVTGTTLRANSILLFVLSLVPFSTAWMAENHFETNTVVVYGIILLAAAFAYYNLSNTLKASEGEHSAFAKAINKDWKGKASLLLYALGTGLSFIHPNIGLVIFAIVALIRFIPDKRMEKAIEMIEDNI
ncbi:hypothetical protein XF24_00080 [candidate division SR1 bacterium Aalborg_AAW-1]|nr:hypothetical protein XF24_00080 [candidate division SR1 bacterium Aalborg_AAW-1]